jgi:hypothetical protein
MDDGYARNPLANNRNGGITQHDVKKKRTYIIADSKNSKLQEFLNISEFESL